MSTETERKFLTNGNLANALKGLCGEKIMQGYLVSLPHLTLRVRIINNTAYLTIKGRTNGLSRPEFEYAIPVSDATELLGLFAGNYVEKTRYCIDYENHTWEVDIFEGENEGLILAEIELNSETETFSLPPWVEVEVSSEPRYFNSNLAKNPFKNWG